MGAANSTVCAGMPVGVYGQGKAGADAQTSPPNRSKSNANPLDGGGGKPKSRRSMSVTAKTTTRVHPTEGSDKAESKSSLGRPDRRNSDSSVILKNKGVERLHEYVVSNVEKQQGKSRAAISGPRTFGKEEKQIVQGSLVRKDDKGTAQPKPQGPQSVQANKQIIGAANVGPKTGPEPIAAKPGQLRRRFSVDRSRATNLTAEIASKREPPPKDFQSSLSKTLFGNPQQLLAVFKRGEQAAANAWSIHECSPGQELIKQGDANGEYCYIVRTGVFVVSVEKPDGSSVKVANFRAGGVFGELSLLFNSKRTATVTAEENATAWGLHRDVYQHILEHDARKEISVRIDFLKKLPGLAEYDEKQLIWVAQTMREVLIPSKTTLNMSDLQDTNAKYLEEGGKAAKLKAGDCMFLVMSGKVDVSPSDVRKPKVSFTENSVLAVGKESDRDYARQFFPMANDQTANPVELWIDTVDTESYSLTVASPTRCLCIGLKEFGLLTGTLPVKKQKAVAKDDKAYAEALDSSQLHALRMGLSKVPWLSTLTEEELNRVIPKFEVESYPEGHFFFRQGDPADKWFVILRGSVSVSVNENNSSREVAQLHAVAAFGERGILWDCERTSNVSCIGSCVCATLTKAVFVEVLPQQVLLLLQTALPPPGTGDKPPLLSDDKKIKMSSLKVERILGKGTYGIVRLVSVADKEEKLALKCISIQKINEMNQEDHILAERNVMLKLDHPFMPKLYSTFRDAQNIYLLTDYYPAGDMLAHYMEHFPFTFEAVRFYVCCVICMFEYLHHKGIIFRDLKLENIMIDKNGYLNLIDFGLSKLLDLGERSYTICGTPMYIAPEVVQKIGHGHEADWWTLGVLTYELIMGYTPFSDEGQVDSTKTIFKNIIDTGYRYSFARNTPKSLRVFVRALLSHNPAERVGYQVRAGAQFVKQHEFFHGFDWRALLERRMDAPVVPTPKNFYSFKADAKDYDLQAIGPYVPSVETSGCLCMRTKTEVGAWHDVFELSW